MMHIPISGALHIRFYRTLTGLSRLLYSTTWYVTIIPSLIGVISVAPGSVWFSIRFGKYESLCEEGECLVEQIQQSITKYPNLHHF